MLKPWAKERPPTVTWVMASYDEKEELRPFLTCSRGCCVYSLSFDCMTIPKLWRLATQEEIAEIKKNNDKNKVMDVIDVFDLYETNENATPQIETLKPDEQKSP